ncbi:hypothetical protein Bca101_036486 [Brassica carinata]
MPVTVNVNRFATHMPNTSPALTYAACYNTSWILRSLCLFYYCESDMNFAIITLCLDLLFIVYWVLLDFGMLMLLTSSPEQCASCCSSPVICNQKLYQIHGAITVASVAASVAVIL